MSRCNTCGEKITKGCVWNQGRCPHRSPMFNEIILDNYKMRYYNLIQTIKGWLR